jgi:hypothetical protein
MAIIDGFPKIFSPPQKFFSPHIEKIAPTPEI